MSLDLDELTKMDTKQGLFSGWLIHLNENDRFAATVLNSNEDTEYVYICSEQSNMELVNQLRPGDTHIKFCQRIVL